MTTWFYTKTCQESKFKGHFGPVDIMAALSTSLFARGMERQETEAGPHINRFTIDIVGGMIAMDAHVTEVEIDGVTLSFHTQHLRFILVALEQCHEREDIGGGHVYHKLHGRFNCLCLLPKHYTALLDKLRELEPVALAVEAAECEDLSRKLSGHHGVRYHRDIPDVPKA